MNTIGQNIRSARKAAKMTQQELANKTNLSRSYVGDIEKDRYNPSVSTLALIATATDTTVSILMGENNLSKEITAALPRGVRIPVLGKVVAGIPIEAVEDIIDYEEIDEKLAKSGTFFALQIKGRSMEPTFHEGDVVIVRQQPEVENGEIAIVLVNGSEATVKEVKESSDGITLIGHNVAAYTPTFYSRQEVADLPVQIIGKVVELRRKF